MSEFKVGDKVCFKTCELPQFYGGVYEVLGQTIAGIFNDEVVIKDGLSRRRIAKRMLRKAEADEITAGFRKGTENFDFYWYSRSKAEEVKAMELLNDMGDDFPIENRISPLCKSKDV
ncbi:hypothetical protein ABTC25_12495 [Acinetobacter baumannii]|nr:hypothetical protein [Acinetobacter baumannii]